MNFYTANVQFSWSSLWKNNHGLSQLYMGNACTKNLWHTAHVFRRDVTHSLFQLIGLLLIDTFLTPHHAIDATCFLGTEIPQTYNLIQMYHTNIRIRAA